MSHPFYETSGLRHMLVSLVRLVDRCAQPLMAACGVLTLLLWPASGVLAQQQTVSDQLTIALCPGATTVNGAEFQQFFFASDGSEQQLVAVRGSQDLTGCTQTQLDTNVSPDLLWAGLPVASQMTDTVSAVLLQGTFAHDAVAVSEIIIPEAEVATAPTDHLPLNANVLPQFTARAFGGEERVTVDGNRSVSCTQGQEIAGVFLQSDQHWPGGATLQLEIAATGTGVFEVSIGDEQRNANEQPLMLGAIDAGTRISYTFDIPANRGVPWNSLTLLCPGEGGELQIQGIVMHPRATEPTETSVVMRERSAWLWSPQLWQQTPERIWALQQREGLQDIYVTVLVSAEGEVESADMLRRFIEEAATRNLRIWAVIGDRHDVLPETRALLHTRLNAYLRYNSEVPSEAQLTGVQLDIEPYLLPGFALAQAEWRKRYLDVVADAQRQLGQQLKLDLVMPGWWGSHALWGNAFFDAMQTTEGLSVTVMNYQTDAARLRDGAEPFLAWGERQGVSIRIALETGPIANETRKRYAFDMNGGELWLTHIGEQPALLLFGTSQRGLGGRAYAFQQQTEVGGGNYSFAGNDGALRAAIAELEPEWAQRSSFSGIALHGLDAEP